MEDSSRCRSGIAPSYGTCLRTVEADRRSIISSGSNETRAFARFFYGALPEQRPESQRDRDPIDAERDERMRPDVFQKELDGEQRHRERYGGSDGQGRRVARDERAAALDEVEASGREHRRHRQQERETHGRRPVDAL